MRGLGMKSAWVASWIVYMAAMLLPLEVRAQSAAEIFTATGVQSGLAVHLGSGDGMLTAQLDNGGKILVHGLALTDEEVKAARKHIQTQGKYGMVSVERGYSWNPLPYADNLANLVVADLDALGAKAPEQAEVMRIVAPLGAAYIKKGGSWSKVAKSFPKEMDEWTHWDHGPESNPLSSDVMVKPATNLQWIAGLQYTQGAPANIGPSNGIRILGGRIFYSYQYHRGKNDKPRYYAGRDGFNGLHLWQTLHVNMEKNIMIATPHGLLTLVEKTPAYLAALDLKTGQVLRTYDKGLKFVYGSNGATSGVKPRMNATYHDGKIIQASGPDLVVLDAATGDVKWKHTDGSPFLNFPTLDTDNGRLFVTAGSAAGIYTRQGLAKDLKAILAFSLADGKKLWSHDLSGWEPGKGGNSVSQLIYDKGALYLYCAHNVLEHAMPDKAPITPYMARLNAADGKLVWKVEPNQKGPSGTTSSRTVMVRDDKIYDMLNWRFYEYDAKTGKENRPTVHAGWERSHTWPGYGCEYQRGTTNYMIISGGYVDKNDMVNRQFVTRSTCATGFFPANGLLYADDGGCRCWAALRGTVAMASDPLLPPVDDKDRLEKSGLSAELGAHAQGSKIPEGSVGFDWLLNYHYNIDTTVLKVGGMVIPKLEQEPINAGGLTIVARVHTQHVEARNGSTPAWNFTVGGRIGAPPVTVDGKVYIGSSDGWVYCINAKDGKLLWRFLAARRDQKMVAFGQVESRWPVMGMTVHGGKVAVTAGWHPEMGGGIHVWGLEPATGAIAWKVNFYSPRLNLPATQAQKLHSNKMLNGKLSSVGGQLQLIGTNFGREYTAVVDIKTWNGLVIDPKTQVTVRIRDFKDLSARKAPVDFVPEIRLRQGHLEVDMGKGRWESAVFKVTNLLGKQVWRKGPNVAEGRMSLELPALAKGTYNLILAAPKHNIVYKFSL